MKLWRQGVRALVLDTDDRVLLVHFDFPPFPWTPPGGGLDAGETDEMALRRELAEELGLDDFELGQAEIRWWTADDLRRSREVFGPRRVPELVGELLESGVPSVPLELGK